MQIQSTKYVYDSCCKIKSSNPREEQIPGNN